MNYLVLIFIAGMTFLSCIWMENITPALSFKDCITFNSTTRTIMITCTSANISDIYNQLHKNNILKRDPSLIEKTWILDASLDIQRGATLYINSTDTDWLKIISDGNITNEIHVFGSLKVDSSKITSWNPNTNNYGNTNGSRQTIQDKLVLSKGLQRPFIKVESQATGTTDITNSEIAYLGYESGDRTGASGLSYYGGDNSQIKNNKIHDLYFGFYSKGVGGLDIENNLIYNNEIYGLDPHTGTHDMIIRNNVVYNNGGFGIICSVDCYNITIEKNKVHDNLHGIMLSRNMTNSIIKDNQIANENKTGIFISDSYNNQITKNTISNSAVAVYLNVKAADNQITKNTISNSQEGITLGVDAGSGNSMLNNKITLSQPGQTDIAFQGNSDLTNNIVKQNKVIKHNTHPRS
ncbi:MAG: right-handed parallel beta-helix repeat-containing protein [Candidatus Nitrosocosmicus sp.]